MDCVAADVHCGPLAAGFAMTKAYDPCFSCQDREEFPDWKSKNTPLWAKRRCETPCYTPEVCGPEAQDCVAVLVEAVGRPVKALPVDATYRVRIWTASGVPRAEAVPEGLFYEAVPALDITLEPTVDAVDMDHSHKKALAEHTELIRKATPCQYTAFAGVRAREAYWNTFLDRFNAYIGSDDRDATPNPNPHVERRRKGHSHAKTKKKKNEADAV